MNRASLEPIPCADRPWLVLPFRALADGKRRLAGLLSDRERYAFNLGMLRRSLRLARRYPGTGRTLVVTCCAGAGAVAQAAGAKVVFQPMHGLDDAAALGVQAAAAEGAHDVLVVSCDLPFADAETLRQMCRIGRGTGGVVLATDRALHGTNALYLPADMRFRFAYGAASRDRHAQQASAAGLPFHLLADSSLAFDVDTPEDYLAWQAEPL